MVRKTQKKVNLKEKVVKKIRPGARSRAGERKEKPRAKTSKLSRLKDLKCPATVKAGSTPGFFILMNPTTLSNYVMSPSTFERVGGMEMLGKLQSLENLGNLVELDSGGASLGQKAYYHKLENAYTSLMDSIYGKR